MKDPKHYLHPVFQNPISATDLHKIYADIERAQNEAYNQAIEDAAERAFKFNGFYESESGSHAIKDSILKLKKSASKSE